jgi:hypothetical protein
MTEPTQENLNTEESSSVVVQNTQQTITTDFETQMNGFKQNGTVAEKSLISGIEQYMKNMAPGKPIDFDVGARQQYQFWKLISGLAENSKTEDFKKLWSILLTYYKKYKTGVFHERYVFRFSENWVWSESELHGFQRVINVINLTCDPAERISGLKQVSLDRSLSEGFTDDARQRIVSYYHQ